MDYIFLHGTGQHSGVWKRTLKFFKTSENVRCPDLYYLAGNSLDYEKIYSAFEKFAGESSGRICLCGQAIGATLALGYAGRNPEKVSSLVLIAPDYKPSRVVKKFQSAVFGRLPKSVYEGTGVTPKDFADFYSSLGEIDFTPLLEKIKVPTLLLCGERDFPHRPTCKMLAKKLPNCRYELVENSGQEFNMDNPQRLGKILVDFLTVQNIGQ